MTNSQATNPNTIRISYNLLSNHRRHPIYHCNRSPTHNRFQPLLTAFFEERYFSFMYPELIYPITPTFSHWVFPHGRVPQLWRNLPIAPSPSPIISAPVGAEYTRNRDKYCRVTNSLYGTEQAHIVPKQAADWFLANHMNVYCHPGPHAKFNDVSNTMLLRADVHRIFDNKELVFFPKSDGNNIKIVSHTLQYKLEHEELKTLYHNRQTYQLVDIRSEFLFARFAWSIFNDTTFPFLNSYPQNFALLVRVSAMAGQSPKVITKHVTSTKDIPPPPFADQKPETSRSGSKRRRKVGYFSVDEEKVVYSSDDEDWYSGSEESDDEATRGRKRERLDNSDSSMPNLSRSALSLDSNSASDASATNVPKVDMGSHGHHPKAEHVVSVRNEAGEC
ncbi:hypothetical protein F5Y06DRAFT_48463 [Hypoxylon sp. FL0890]|nr:hypothetical protein F5Y06DRAFT_48463 [Hypoxylon sp. FL0890]